MTKQEFIAWAERHGYELDKWGHLQKTVDGKQCRLKLMPRVVRREIQVKHAPHPWQPTRHHTEWVRTASWSWKDLQIMIGTI